MKYLLILFTCFTFGQNIEADCSIDFKIRRGEIKTADTLKFETSYLLLMQDNSVMYVWNLQGYGQIYRADAGGGKRIDSLGIDRRNGDENPLLILIGCLEDYSNLDVGSNIDVVHITDFCDD